MEIFSTVKASVMKYGWLICLMLGALPGVRAQEADEQRCGNFGEAKMRQAQAYFFAHQAALQQQIARHGHQPSPFRPENFQYRLPIVFHVLHYGEPVGEGTNISAGQVYSQLEVLNEDYQRRNPDFASTLAAFQPVAGQMSIEFYPARDNPTGQRLAEPGINRIQIPRPASGFFWTNESFDRDFKPRNLWDPNRYLNVWVVDSLRLGGALGAGYAQFPDLSGLAGVPVNNGGATTDGLVARYTRIGSVTKVPSARPLRHSQPGRFDRGRTLTHEMGHFLGLLHPFEGGSCTVDGDFCPDTPPTNSSTLNCNLNLAPCGVPVMAQNFMQFTDDACMSLFTACQVQRMTTVLEVAPRRRSLLTSNVGDGGPVTGLAQTDFSQRVRLYPNPARQQVRVQLPFYAAARQVILYNPLGQAVRQWDATGTQLDLELAGMPAGVYYLHLQTAQGAAVKPLVVTNE
ncbi:MAG: zinc-dependent metalloprotease [Bernardetiaceae bacterium]|jgi:hypothetical protein|nr:zinc-dependent metalloprotease [Bernardetiaceae bacterium]